MAGRKRTPTDPEFLRAVSDALVIYKIAKGPRYSNASLATDLGVDESTIAKYINRKFPIMGEVLARACQLGVTVRYGDYVISAASFAGVTATPPQPQTQLEFLFDAGYAAEKDSWSITRKRAEPMEFTLRIKIAS
jgi:transcriptional regulator with XRE-family HTH domain